MLEQNRQYYNDKRNLKKVYGDTFSFYFFQSYGIRSQTGERRKATSLIPVILHFNMEYL